MSDTTARFGIVEPSADRHDAADVPYYIRQAVAGIERSVMYGQGLIADIPAFGIQGRIYASTDEVPKRVYYDTGAAWFPVGEIPAGYVTSAMIADGTIADIDVAGAAAINISKIANKFCLLQANGTAVVDDTWTAIAFDGELYDNDTMHSNVTNNTRITFKTAGYYLLFAQLKSDPSYSAGSSQAVIYKNGTTWDSALAGAVGVAGDAWNGASRGVVIDIMIAAVNDYAEVKVGIHAGNNPSTVTGHFGAVRIA